MNRLHRGDNPKGGKSRNIQYREMLNVFDSPTKFLLVRVSLKRVFK